MNRVLQKPFNTKLLKNHKTDELNMCEVAYAPLLRQPRHTHKFASFSYVLKGNYAERIGNRTHSRRDSTVIFHPPEESHAVLFETDVRILSVELSFEKLFGIQRHSAVFDDSASCRSEKIDQLGNKIYQEFCRLDAFSMLAIEGLILELLAEASRFKVDSKEKNFPRWLDRARDFLHANFAESFTLEEVAQIADVHPVHLSRVFREKFDCTIGEYLRRLRVEFARKQITSTELPLCEIAYAAGFSDQSHLNKTFKSFFGSTPAEHRKSNRER